MILNRIRRQLLRALPGLIGVATSTAMADLLINELDSDQPGTDTMEFVELINTGPAAVDFAVTPYILVFFNGADDTPPTIDGSYQTIELTGMLASGDFLVVGGSMVPNVDIVIGSGGSNLIQNGPDAVALYTGKSADWSGERAPRTNGLVDALVYDTGDMDDESLKEALGGLGQYDEWGGQGSFGAIYSLARFAGGGMWRTSATPTPGEDNDVSPPVVADAGVTLLHVNPPAPVPVLLSASSGFVPRRFRILSLPSIGTLFDSTTPIDGSGNTTLPHELVGDLSYIPESDFSGVDEFDFDVVDSADRMSEPATQELAVQRGGVFMTEIMHTPGTPQIPRDQRIYEYVEIVNATDTPVALSRLDTNLNQSTDTTNNLYVDGATVHIPANSVRIIAPGGLTPDSDEQFRCEWRLDESDLLRIPVDRFELMFAGSRLLLFDANDQLLDAVNLSPPDFWTPIPGASQSVSALYLNLFGLEMDSLGNDRIPLWLFTGPENTDGMRIAESGGGAGSPGFVPAGILEDFTPLPPCQPPIEGPCCLPNGNCDIRRIDHCSDAGGDFHENEVDCQKVKPCPQPNNGACCLYNGVCVLDDFYDCTQMGGEFGGENTLCDQMPIPACVNPVEVRINEMLRNDSGIDDQEYIEIHAPSHFDLSLLTLVEIEGDYGADGRQGVIDQLWTLSGHTAPSNGLFVIGDRLVPNVDLSVGNSGSLENGTATYVILVGYDGAHGEGSDLDVDNNGIIDANVVLGQVVDGLAFADGGVNGTTGSVDRTYFGVIVIGPDGSSAPDGVARMEDGFDTGSSGDFCWMDLNGQGPAGEWTASPGFSNDCDGCPTPGDYNGDDRIDLRDFAVFQSCFTGGAIVTGSPVYSISCGCFDSDMDGDTDIVDFDSLFTVK